MKVTTYTTTGTKDGEIELPVIFSTPFRRELIHKACTNLTSHKFQPQGRHPSAGQDVVADSNDPPTGQGVSRVARAQGGGGGRQGQGAEVASTRGGRQAHPPIVGKVIYKKLNKKENKLALCSAIAATAFSRSSFTAASASATAFVFASTLADASWATFASASGFASSYTTDNASNSLFELAFSGTDSRGINGIAYILRGTSYGDVRILTGDWPNPDLLDIYGAVDVRGASNMIGTAQGYPTMLGKFPSMNGADNVTLFRVEEMHLIAAETSLRAGNTADALTYLNNIPAIRGLGAGYYASATLENILEERRKEFAFEGLRFHDLTRMGMDMPQIDSFKQLNDDLTGTPPAYGSHRYAYPIALAERNANPNMVQNYGY